MANISRRVNILEIAGHDLRFSGPLNNLVPLENIKADRSDCGHIIKIKAIQPVTLSMPVNNRRLIVADEFETIEPGLTISFYSKGPTSLLRNDTQFTINSSIIHLLSVENAHSFSVFGECAIFCFVQKYEWYVSITGVPNRDEIIFYLDTSTNYRTNLQRQPIRRQRMEFFDALDLDDMRHAIFHGAQLCRRSRNGSKLVKEAKEIQDSLKNQDIKSVIIGSLAAFLNGANTSPKDIDLMLESQLKMKSAATIMSDIGYQIKISTRKSIRLEHSDLCMRVDLSYDNYRILSQLSCIREKHGLRFFDLDGLSWLSLLMQQEIERTSYSNRMYQRNKKALFDLTRQAWKAASVCNPAVAQDMCRYENYTRQCLRLCNKLYRLPLLYWDVRVNIPFRVNAFGNKHRYLLPLINMSEKADARIVLSERVGRATWSDVSGKTIALRTERNKSLSYIFVDAIELPGLITCEQ